MPTSNTPLPARDLLALADAMADAIEAYEASFADADLDSGVQHKNAMLDTAEAYRAARKASPVTLEEALMIEEHNALTSYYCRIWDNAPDGGPTEECQQALELSNETELKRIAHARALAEAQKGGA